MRFTAIMAGLLLIGILAVPGQTQAPDAASSENIRTFMRVKLRHAQRVLEGLALEDYGLIAKHSQELSLLSLAASWQVLQTPKYMEQSADFRRTADRMTKAAQQGNLDGATLAYVETTMKCVECHKYVREVRLSRLDTNRPAAITSLSR